jgi:hypothetical protein
VYRRASQSAGALQSAAGGSPHWLQGRVDADNIAARGAAAAIADAAGNLYVSEDAGRTRAHRERLRSPSGLFIY